MESRGAVGDALRGLAIPELPTGSTPVEAVCIVEGCDIVFGFGSDRASVRMAELLLNIGIQDTEIDEYQFWSEFYYRSVAIGSLELAIWLPGSIGCIESDD